MTTHRTVHSVIHAIVLDPQPLWRRTLASMLARSGVPVIAECSAADEIAETAAFRPQLMVADPDDVAGFCDRLRELRRTLPRLTTIVVTSRDDAAWRRELEVAGAVEFIRKDSELDVLEETLNAAIEAHLEWSSVTSRELEILALVAPGRSNREVAAVLWLSEETVKFHLANVYRKLSVGGRREAVDHARSEGILPPAFEGYSDAKEDGAPLVAAVVAGDAGRSSDGKACVHADVRSLMS
jgi:DNA-binding NarL/FixJ family response regulator